MAKHDADQTATSFVFQVRSLTSRPVSEVLDEIQRLTPRMAADLAELDSELRITADREKTVPVDPVTILIIVSVVNITAKPFVEGFFNRLGEKLADYMTENIDNISVTQKPETS